MVKEIDNIKDYNLLHGHELDTRKLIINDEVINCVQEINDIDVRSVNGIDINYINEEILKEKTVSFFKRHFKLHKVGYLSDKKLTSIINNYKIKDINDLANIYNKSASYINPYSIPIKYEYDNILRGSLVIQVFDVDDHKLFAELLPKLNSYFTSIILPNITTELSVSTYIHELTHSQLESNKGIIKKFYNSELLSIFMELLYNYEYDPNTYKVVFVNKINHILQCFNYLYASNNSDYDKELDKYDYDPFDYFTNTKYLISTLKAFNLFDKYINSNNKEEIISCIQKVFDGNRSLEELLYKFDISIRSSLDSNITKRLMLN